MANRITAASSRNEIRALYSSELYQLSIAAESEFKQCNDLMGYRTMNYFATFARSINLPPYGSIDAIAFGEYSLNF